MGAVLTLCTDREVPIAPAIARVCVRPAQSAVSVPVADAEGRGRPRCSTSGGARNRG